MRNAETVLGVIQERGKRGLPLEDLYRQLFNRELYLRAYGRLYRRKGALTRGATPETVDGASGEERGPKYLGLPGPKPLLGWEDAIRDTRVVCLVEGPLDLLTLRMWGVPAVALAGSAPSHHNLSLLSCFDRVYLALDQDVAGRKATERLQDQLGSRAVPIELPPGVKDVAELARRPAGQLPDTAWRE